MQLVPLHGLPLPCAITASSLHLHPLSTCTLCGSTSTFLASSWPDKPSLLTYFSITLLLFQDTVQDTSTPLLSVPT